MFLNNKLFVFSILFCACFNLSASSIITSEKDSTENYIDSEILFLNEKGLIKTMDKEQLNALVDYLFEMDTLPQNLITQINIAIKNIGSEKVVNSKNIVGETFPATDVYASWEINKLFSEKDVVSVKQDLQ